MKLYRTFYFNRIKFIAILKKSVWGFCLGGAGVEGRKKSVEQVSGTLQFDFQLRCAGHNLDPRRGDALTYGLGVRFNSPRTSRTEQDRTSRTEQGKRRCSAAAARCLCPLLHELADAPRPLHSAGCA